MARLGLNMSEGIGKREEMYRLRDHLNQESQAEKHGRHGRVLRHLPRGTRMRDLLYRLSRMRGCEGHHCLRRRRCRVHDTPRCRVHSILRHSNISLISLMIDPDHHSQGRRAIRMGRREHRSQLINYSSSEERTSRVLCRPCRRRMAILGKRRWTTGRCEHRSSYRLCKHHNNSKHNYRRNIIRSRNNDNTHYDKRSHNTANPSQHRNNPSLQNNLPRTS